MSKDYSYVPMPKFKPELWDFDDVREEKKAAFMKAEEIYYARLFQKRSGSMYHSFVFELLPIVAIGYSAYVQVFSLYGAPLFGLHYFQGYPPTKADYGFSLLFFTFHFGRSKDIYFFSKKLSYERY